MKEKMMKDVTAKLKTYMVEMKREIGALYCAYRKPDTPILPKIVAMIVVAYALSPIDFIPDFIPLLGYLDDVILLPLGIGLALKLMPDDLMMACREEAALTFQKNKKSFWYAGVLIVLIWLLIIWKALKLFVFSR